ncbi:MAG: DUF6531 domain-containing protein [Polyangiaceae bacterium]
MGTTSGKRNVATTGSGHVATSPPATSLVPPPASPTTPPTFAPFPYVARSATAEQTSDRLKVGGHPVLVKGSVMSVDPPANTPALPTGDIVTAAKVKKAHVTDGSSRTTSGGQPVAQTGSLVAMNVLTGQENTAQVMTPLIEGAGAGAAGGDSGGAEGTEKNKKNAVPARPAKECTTEGHPVDVASGFVVDSATDIALPGVIPFVWKRRYSSSAAREDATALGKGGWFHSFDQWVEPMEGGYRYETGDARQIAIPQGADGRMFHRGEQLVLSEERRGEVWIASLTDRRTRVFAKVRNHDRLYLVAIRDAWGNAIRLEYAAGRLSRIFDTAGREVRVLSNPRGRVQRLEVRGAPESGAAPEAAGASAPLLWIDYAYHPEGELARVENALGHADRFEYDGFHRMVKTTLKNGVSFRYEYDEKGRCKRTRGDIDARLFGEGDAALPLHNVEFSFEPDGVTTTSGTRRPRRYACNTQGLVTREETFGGDHAVVRAYDSDEYLLSESNAAGETTTFQRDARGHLTKRVDPAGNLTSWEIVDDLPRKRIDPGPEGPLVTEYFYEGHGALAGVQLPTGALIQVRHDSHGRAAEVTGPEGRLATYEHDAQHNLSSESSARGGVTRYRYDPLGRPVARTDALGRTTTVTYDLLGRPVEVRFPDGRATRSTYEPLGHLASFTDALGETTRLEYAGTGVLVKLIQPDGQVYRFRYDENEQLRRVENPCAERYSFDYDEVGRVTRERTFDARWLEYQYNKANRLARIQYGKEDWRAFSYDPLGNVIEDRCLDGGMFFERDNLGRLKKAVVEDWQKTDIVTEITHDRFGRVAAEKQAAGELAYEHDALGRRVARTIRVQGLLERTTRYAYTADGALAGLDHQGQRIAVEHDALGRETRKHVYGAGVDIQSRYDAMDRLAEQRVTAPGTEAGRAFRELAHRTWHHDAVGRPTALEDTRWGTSTYVYDKIGNVVEARRGKDLEVFEYDPTGSLKKILKSVGEAARPSWDIQEGNRLRRTEGARFKDDERGRRIQKIEFGKGQDPGLRGKPGADNEVTLYGWDGRARLREVVLPDKTKVRFWYDAFGRRVKKEVFPPALSDLKAMALLALEKGADALPKPRVVEYVWDGYVLAAEIERGRAAHVDPSTPALDDAATAVTKNAAAKTGAAAHARAELLLSTRDGAPIRASTIAEANGIPDASRPRPAEPWSRFHVHEPATFTPVLQEEAGAVFAVVNDHLGMPKELIDPSGRVAWAAVHTAWGRVVETWRDPAAVARWGELESPFRLLGQYEDLETGLRYTRFRYFDAEFGRWVSPDPLGYFGGANSLAFEAAPTWLVDPLGLACEVPHGFKDEEQFRQFGAIIEGDLNGLSDYYVAYIQGSAATGQNYHTGRPFGPHSDIDLAIGSKDLFRTFASDPTADVRGNRIHFGDEGAPAMLQPMRQKLSALVGREVNIMVFDSPRSATARGKSIPVPK